MSDLQEISIEWPCDCCGNDSMTLHTDALQESDEFEWWAVDGDTVVCDECGYHHQVVCDAETETYIRGLDDDDHEINVKVYAEYMSNEEEWKRACDRLGDEPAGTEEAVIEARHVLGMARLLAGVACEDCYGSGVKMYSSTTLWRGGFGGQMMTNGTCDACWGTGRNDKQGVDLRRLRAMLTPEQLKALRGGG